MKFYTQFKCLGRTIPALKFLFVMKLFAFLPFPAFLQVSFAVSAQNVTLSEKNASLEQVFRKIRSQTGYNILCDAELIKEANPVDVKVNNAPLEEALQKSLAGQRLSYIISKNTIVIKREPLIRREPPGALLSSPPPQVIIQGKVLDENEQPLQGVSILLKNTTIGTSTNINGEYLLNIPDENANGILVFSFTGYQNQEFPLNKQNRVDVKLLPEQHALNTVVVVGYGTQRRKDITGAVGSVSPDRFKEQPITNVEQALKGQVAGVQVSQNSGSPGGGVSVKIRGTGSITAGSEPLYVIDGFPVSAGERGQTGIASGNPLNSINPNDIESIDILKDASATAIYGSRGSNGVVIITTKSGRAGKGKITLDAYTGFQEVTKQLDLLNAAEFAELHIEARNNAWIQSGGNPATPVGQRGRFSYTPFWTDPSQWTPTNWQDVIFRRGTINNYNLSATGGSENIRYALSGGYFSNQGVIINSSLKRYSFRSNIDATINKKIKIGFKFNPSYTVNRAIRSDGAFFGEGGLVNSALLHVPNVGPYDSSGYRGYTSQRALRSTLLGTTIASGVNNPLARALEDDYQLDQGRILGSTFVEWEIFKGLRFRSTLGIDAAFNRTHEFNSSVNTIGAAVPPGVPSGSASSSQELDWLNENLLTYEKTFQEKHRITAIAGYSAQKNDFRLINISGTQYPNDNVQYVNAAGLINGGTELRSQWSLLSSFARVNYSLSDKYLLTATFRRDGSSRFGSNRKYGNFPSAAFGWRLSEEEFMQRISFINNLKLRVSYGVSGNNRIGNYTHLANTNIVNYIIGASQTPVNGFRASGLGNDNLTWETTKSYNVGIDLSVLKNRIDFTAEYYKSNTDGLLLNVNIPVVSGFGGRNENIGEVENRGVELSLNTRNFISAFKWSSNFNISFNRNKVLALGGSAGDFIANGSARTVVGRPLSQFFVRITDGVFNTQSEIDKSPPQDNSPKPGERRFKDVNGDGKVDNNDLAFAGDPNPDFTFGFTNSFSFKGFDLNILLNGSQGNDIFYSSLAALTNINGNLNNIGMIRNRWRSPENPGSGNIPKALFGFANLPDVPSDFYIFDGSYLRISNITLAYNLPADWVTRARISNARLYLSGQNLRTFTKYLGYDPETATRGGSTQSGFDNGIYPLAKTFSLGINVTF